MYRVAVVSGKGGTGKTFIASSLTILISQESSVVSIDADVEAPDLEIALGGGDVIEVKELYEGRVAEVSYERCFRCLKCTEVCRFSAISVLEGNVPVIDKYLCEGCGACSIVCPSGAISYVPSKLGTMKVVRTKFGYLVTASLDLGRRGSGHLVELEKSRGLELAKESDAKFIVLDGPPGIGCPLIATVVDADYVVIVTEPTPQAFHGLARVAEVVKFFGKKFGVVINKFDINEEYCTLVEKWCKEHGGSILGSLPYDRCVVEAYTRVTPPLLYCKERKSPCFEAMMLIYENLLRDLGV